MYSHKTVYYIIAMIPVQQYTCIHVLSLHTMNPPLIPLKERKAIQRECSLRAVLFSIIMLSNSNPSTYSVHVLNSVLTPK